MRYLEIRNFRCFDRFDIEFHRDTNLLVGDNASGKTSLLKACKYVLGAFFSGFSDENTSFTTPGCNDFHNVIVKGNLIPPSPIEFSFDIMDLAGDGLPRQIYKKVSAKNSRPLLGGFKELRKYSHDILENMYVNNRRELPLPLFVAFSTEDIHVTRKISADKFKAYTPKNSFGYYECLNANGLLKYWLDRMLILAEAEMERELTIVRRAISDALGAEGCGVISDIHIRPLKKKVYFVFPDGREVETDLLSDGYKRLVNIVIDLAFRAAILNGNLYGESAAHKTRGTVLIDEVDLHLHPSLQGNVLEGLRRAFPKLQIIASTHSPIVMSSAVSDENNKVILMRYDKDRYEYQAFDANTYGLDSTVIIEDTLHLPARDRKVREALGSLFSSIDEENYDAALKQLKDLRERFGDRIPELERASALLRLISLDYEKD